MLIKIFSILQNDVIRIEINIKIGGGFSTMNTTIWGKLFEWMIHVQLFLLSKNFEKQMLTPK